MLLVCHFWLMPLLTMTPLQGCGKGFFVLLCCNSCVLSCADGPPQGTQIACPEADAHLKSRSSGPCVCRCWAITPQTCRRARSSLGRS